MAEVFAHIDGREAYRRKVMRPDGRYTCLYGYAPPDAELLPEPPAEVAKGGELRFHPFREEWNVYAAHRQNRTFKPSAADDPLAPSVPGQPPTDIPFADFELCIFENRFTSLHPDAPEASAPEGVGSRPARGRCEVVVYTPEPEGNLHTIGQVRRRLLLEAWIDRYRALFAEGHRFILPFENRGDAVGVTLPHPHGQIYAFDFVPQVQQRMASAFAAGHSLADDLVREWEAHGVAESGGVRAWCPPYARFPFECWLVPERRLHGPWDMTETELNAFAHLLGDITRRYDAHFGQETAYMLALHAAPDSESKGWHFHAQFTPLLRAPERVKYLASVEQHTGVFTVDVMPEHAADMLRAQA